MSRWLALALCASLSFACTQVKDTLAVQEDVIGPDTSLLGDTDAPPDAPADGTGTVDTVASDAPADGTATVDTVASDAPADGTGTVDTVASDGLTTDQGVTSGDADASSTTETDGGSPEDTAGDGDAADAGAVVPPDAACPPEICNGVDDDCDSSIDEGFCQDDDPCTLPKCGADGTCAAAPDGTPCEDGSSCSEPDSCTLGLCASGPSKDCDDDNPCTDDVCSPQLGCVYTNNTDPCDDEKDCTLEDVCDSGVCSGSSPTEGAVSDYALFSKASEGITESVGVKDWFGRDVAHLGDLDGDGLIEVAVGASRDHTPGCDQCGSVTIVSLGSDGLPVSSTLIANGINGGPSGTSLLEAFYFGSSVAAIGDVDGDGIVDLAVGTPQDDYGPGKALGSVWIFFLQADGTAKASNKLGYYAPIFDNTTILQAGDEFGIAVASAGDRNGDGVPDLMVGARYDDDGGGNIGAFYFVYLDETGEATGHKKFSATAGEYESNIPGDLASEDQLGTGVANLGDLDGDGVSDIAVGAAQGDSGAVSNCGAIYISLMNADDTIKSTQKLTSQSDAFYLTLSAGDKFGFGISAPGDLNGDGIPDLIAPVLGSNQLYLLYLNADGTLLAHESLPASQFDAANTNFGTGTALIPDLNGNGVPEILVGANAVDIDGNNEAGGVYTLFLAPGADCD